MALEGPIVKIQDHVIVQNQSIFSISIKDYPKKELPKKNRRDGLDIIGTGVYC